MKKTLCNVLLVATGATIGSLVTWKVVETKYARIAQEEIDSVKDSYKRVMDLQKKEVEAYRKMFNAQKALDEEDEQDDPEVEELDNDAEDDDYPDDDERDFTEAERAQVEYYKLSSKYRPGYSDKKDQNGVEYIVGNDAEMDNYDEEGEEGSEDLVQFVNGPYVISPEEFGDIKEFSSQALDYFADGVLADGWGVELDIEETIGEDALDHFGDYVDDIVYVRNERTEIDYEVTRDPRTYGEAVRTSQNPYYGHEN